MSALLSLFVENLMLLVFDLWRFLGNVECENYEFLEFGLMKF